MDDIFGVIGGFILIGLLLEFIAPLLEFLLVAGLVIFGFYLFYSIVTGIEKEKERKLEIAKKEKEEVKKRHDEIEKVISSEYLSVSPIEFQKMNTYINSLPLEDRKYCIEYLKRYKGKLIDYSVDVLNNEKYSEALEVWQLLSKIYPDDENYITYIERTNQIIVKSKTQVCSFIDKTTYGKGKYSGDWYTHFGISEKNNLDDLFDQFLAYTMLLTHQESARNIAIYLTMYLLLLDTIRKIKPEYYSVSIDEMISLDYIKIHYAKLNDLEPFVSRNDGNIRNYIQSTTDKNILIQFASALRWSGDRKMELECLARLNDLNLLPEKFSSVYNVLKNNQITDMNTFK